jgi:polyisoprenoid-binding protein YceI
METVKTSEKVYTKWVLDPSHSEIMFKVKHLMIANVKGEFVKFKAEIDGPDFSESPVNVSIDASSISTNDDARDNHLKGTDFFDTDHYKEITFEGTSYKKVKDDQYELRGMLKIKGISKEVKLDVEFGGISRDPWGNEKAGFSVSGTINRKDWGLTWNAPLEAGGVLVSDEVKILADVQFVKQPV